MNTNIPFLYVLVALALAGGCVRELSEAQCPCLAGWECCAEENVCKPEGMCEPGDAEQRSVSDGGAFDAGEWSVDATPGAACDAGPGSVPSVCPGGPFAYSHLATSHETLATLVGRWRVCDGTGFRWGPDDAHAGIEFASDGKFYLLRQNASGALERAVGVHSSGSYLTGPSEQDLNIYFHFPEGGGASFFPSFDASKRRLLAGGDSGFDSAYVRIPEVKMEKARECAGGPFSFATLESYEATLQAVVGRWQVCAGQGFGWGPTNARSGIEFADDGRYHLLGEDESGALVRVVGIRATGTYRTEAQGDSLYLLFPEGGGFLFVPSFDAQRNHLYANAAVDENPTFVRVPPGAPNAGAQTPAVPDASACALPGR